MCCKYLGLPVCFAALAPDLRQWDHNLGGRENLNFCKTSPRALPQKRCAQSLARYSSWLVHGQLAELAVNCKNCASVKPGIEIRCEKSWFVMISTKLHSAQGGFWSLEFQVHKHHPARSDSACHGFPLTYSTRTFICSAIESDIKNPKSSWFWSTTAIKGTFHHPDATKKL